MLQKIWERKASDKGFTLIELLIVIIILGILAAIVIFGVATFRSDSVERACKTDRKNVDTAAAAHYAKNGTEAANIPELVTENYLRSNPNTAQTNYTITYTPATLTDGSWTVTGSATDCNL